jgi:pilus assembly protein Flp/PilA
LALLDTYISTANRICFAVTPHFGNSISEEKRMTKLLSRFVSETEGQDLIEYALLAAIIALGVITAMAGVRTALNTQYNAISTAIAS